MKQLDIRFVKEKDKNRAQQQTVVIARLQERLPDRIAEKFEDVNVRIRFSSSAGADVTGFRDKDERERFMEFLEELWQDDTLVSE